VLLKKLGALYRLAVILTGTLVALVAKGLVSIYLSPFSPLPRLFFSVACFAAMRFFAAASEAFFARALRSSASCSSPRPCRPLHHISYQGSSATRRLPGAFAPP
jgi:hypothetical protein